MKPAQNIDNALALKKLNQFKRTGSSKDLGTLYQHYMQMVFAVGMTYYKDQNDAEDLVMHVFEVLYKKAANYDVSNVSSWIYTIAKNECLMTLRKTKREFSSDEIKNSDEFMESEQIYHLFEESDDENDWQQLNHCLNQLKTEQKLCIELFYLEGKTYKEIADQTQLDLKKIKSSIQNGKRNLKICMESTNE